MKSRASWLIALAEFAESYGDQTETDHASLVKAIRKGRVKALEGI